jgi:hypothetical protein
MITYNAATPAEIDRRISAHNAGWKAKAGIETAKVIAAGRFSPPKAAKGTKKTASPPSLWGEVKIVFMQLQHFKCIFCERALAKSEGAIEHDIEHYRPKNAVVAWKAPKIMPAVPHQVGPAATTGYFWLAYDSKNYAAACKLCNSTRKRSFFPIHGLRGSALQSVADLDMIEQPLVIFPIDEDPEALITFRGVLAIPVQSTGFGNLRALVTIALFNLNGREELIDDRFRQIRSVFSAFNMMMEGSSQAKRIDGMTQIAELISPESPQSACAKAYLELLRSNPQAAWQVYQDARAYKAP